MQSLTDFFIPMFLGFIINVASLAAIAKEAEPTFSPFQFIRENWPMFFLRLLSIIAIAFYGRNALDSIMPGVQESSFALVIAGFTIDDVIKRVFGIGSPGKH